MHIYIHVPFCRRRCSYCDFAIAVRREVPGRQFTQTVLRELEIRGLPDASPGAGVDTLYLGGGTPSLLPPDQLALLIDAFAIARSAEVTLEVNPDDVTHEHASAWVAAGINRVSLGAQSFQDHVLAWMHRTHDGRATDRAVEILRSAGVANISLDLIFGLPTELHHDFAADLARVRAHAPEHVSVYGLSVEPRTPLARWISRGRTTPVNDDRYATQFLEAHDALTGAGFEHYEISSFAAGARHRSRHNSAYWDGSAYLGVGPSAHGFMDNRRRWNVPHWAQYVRLVESGQDPVESEEVLTREQQDLEAVYLGLRTSAGIAVEQTPGRAGEGLSRAAEGLIQCRDNRWCATPAGWLVLDTLVAGLTTSGEGG